MPNHMISVYPFTKQTLLYYIERAVQIKKEKCHLTFPTKTMITLFYEPSTRTSCSFQSAAIKMGCSIISIHDTFSSSQKGETLEDTIKTIQCYGDVIVLRHPEKGSAKKASNVSNIPIINAGDGNGEHPTQALLDLFTIYTELTHYNINLDDIHRSTLTITFVGDLKNSRTIHSLIHVLTFFPNIRFIYVAPPSLELPITIVNDLNALNILQINMSLQKAIPHTDILYMTRIQKERFEHEDEYHTIMNNCENFILTPSLLTYAKSTMLIMHPLPRTNEIDISIDQDERAIYFKQVENGIYIRIAILEELFKN
jgi:aspartate carbamoyltransferase